MRPGDLRRSMKLTDLAAALALLEMQKNEAALASCRLKGSLRVVMPSLLMPERVHCWMPCRRFVAAERSSAQ